MSPLRGLCVVFKERSSDILVENYRLPIEYNTKFGLRIDKPEIDRINFNLGIGIKLFDI